MWACDTAQGQVPLTPHSKNSHHLYVCRNASLVAALLAVCKAGGVYIPLDPLYPADRCAGMMEDGAAKALITVADLAPAFMARLPDDLCIIELDDDVMADIANQPRDESEELPQAEEGDLAYCIFTSGSTGRPKGVPIYHTALMNLLASFQAEVRSWPLMTADSAAAARLAWWQCCGQCAVRCHLARWPVAASSTVSLARVTRFVANAFFGHMRALAQRITAAMFRSPECMLATITSTHRPIQTDRTWALCSSAQRATTASSR